MLVAIDTLGIRPGWGGAEETYLRKLLETLGHSGSATRFVILTNEENHRSFEPYDRVEVSKDKHVIRACKEANADILFAPLARMPDDKTFPILPYALQTREFEGRKSKGLFGRDTLRGIKTRLQSVTTIVAASKYVQQQLLALLEIPLNKVLIAPPGVDDVFGTDQTCIVEKPFILAVGNTDTWKNIPLLLAAFDRLKDEIPQSLVVIGRPGDAEPTEWNDRVFRIDRLPRANLAGLYQNSDVFVRTASDDGTAISVLEALAAGAVIVAPRAGAISEIGGNAPMYFKGESVDSLVTTLRHAIDMDDEERDRRTTLGRQLATGFEWELTANQILKGLRKTLG